MRYFKFKMCLKSKKWYIFTQCVNCHKKWGYEASHHIPSHPETGWCGRSIEAAESPRPAPAGESMHVSKGFNIKRVQTKLCTFCRVHEFVYMHINLLPWGMMPSTSAHRLGKHCVEEAWGQSFDKSRLSPGILTKSLWSSKHMSIGAFGLVNQRDWARPCTYKHVSIAWS